MSNPFLERIASGEIRSVDELKTLYRAEAKRLHPDLQGDQAPGVDFDRMKGHYHAALKALLSRAEPEPEVAPVAPVATVPAELRTREAFLEEFRNLVARGFPVNVQAAAKNKAYTASIRLVSAYLGRQFHDADFFARVNGQTRTLKRTDPGSHWYVIQIYCSIGDFYSTGFAYYQRLYQRHLDFVRDALVEGGYHDLLALLAFLVEGEAARREASTPAGSKSPRPGK